MYTKWSTNQKNQYIRFIFLDTGMIYSSRVKHVINLASCINKSLSYQLIRNFIKFNFLFICQILICEIAKLFKLCYTVIQFSECRWLYTFVSLDVFSTILTLRCMIRFIRFIIIGFIFSDNLNQTLISI